jgi:hypothetical protein
MSCRPALLLVFALTGLPAAGPAVAGPVVVELFTSQGCSSCPPADALLGELAESGVVIALSLHVDYWNRLGWTDPFSKPAFSERQRAYAETLEDDNPYTTGVYTPQIVVNGRYAVVGHVANRVHAAIDKAGRMPAWTDPRVVGDSPEEVLLPANTRSPLREPASVWLITYDDRHVTPVEHGENADRVLVNHRVVRSMRRIGRWDGRETRLAIGKPAPESAQRDGLVVLVQQADTGIIIGAAERRLLNTNTPH